MEDTNKEFFSKKSDYLKAIPSIRTYFIDLSSLQNNSRVLKSSAFTSAVM